MYGIVFIETRDKPGLSQIFKRHIKFVPELEPLVVCSEANKYQFDEFKKMVIPGPKDITEYNKIITSTWFWELIPFEKVLICEHESGLLREGIEEFYKWDYVGAPWWFQETGGNGGLSWRSVKAMKQITLRYKYNLMNGNEDTYFCSLLENIAPREVCERFSVETVFKLGTLGYHFGSDAKRMLTEDERTQILNQYESVN